MAPLPSFYEYHSHCYIHIYIYMESAKASGRNSQLSVHFYYIFVNDTNKFNMHICHIIIVYTRGCRIFVILFIRFRFFAHSGFYGARLRGRTHVFMASFLGNECVTHHQINTISTNSMLCVALAFPLTTDANVLWLFLTHNNTRLERHQKSSTI